MHDDDAAVLEGDLRNFIRDYWGYGNPEAGGWFVGMEEGGDPTWDEVARLVHRWARAGGPAFTDLRPEQIPEDHRHFGTRPRLVRYWAAVSRIALPEQGRAPSTEAVRQFQRRELAARRGDTCLLELLPLPSPTTGQWMYGEHARLPELRSRGTYLDRLVPTRRAALGALIHTHTPRYVVFLGTSYQQHWNTAVQRRLPVWPDDPLTDDRTGVTMITIRHPSSHGVTNADLDAVGDALRRQTGRDR